MMGGRYGEGEVDKGGQIRAVSGDIYTGEGRLRSGRMGREQTRRTQRKSRKTGRDKDEEMVAVAEAKAQQKSIYTEEAFIHDLLSHDSIAVPVQKTPIRCRSSPMVLDSFRS
jgi:hypothetical protein